MTLDDIRRDIEYRRKQILRQRREIEQLRRAGIKTGSAEALLKRMLDKIDELCGERERLRREQDAPRYPGTNRRIRGTQRRAG